MLSNLRLQNFRSYQDSLYEFGERVNIIVGPNGVGKTNLLEAIQVLANGDSYRANDDELVSFGSEWFRLDGALLSDSVRTCKYTSVPRPKKIFELDEKTYLRLPARQTLPFVLFEPNHLTLLHGPPEQRRNYLDALLEQITPGYGTIRRNYRRVLLQRNALLKRGRVSAEEMFPWNLRLSELGAAIARSRAALTMELSPQLADLYKLLARSTQLAAADYSAQFPLGSYESSLLAKLESSLEREVERGFTAYGPHREDMAVTLDGHPVSLSASRGETRTIVLAFKIMELEKLESVRGQTPVLLLDDVFSELDGARRKALTAYLERCQTFLTTTDADIVVKHFTDSTILPLGGVH